MSKQSTAYGSWSSPITAELLTQANVGFSEPHIEGSSIYWLESRPLERGRTAIVRLNEKGQKEELLPAPLNARSRVNEYGGGSYCLDGEQVYFVQFDDQRIYALADKGGRAAPQPLTPEAQWAFGDLTLDRSRQRLLAVREDHSASGEAETTLVAISLSGDAEPRVLLQGRAFYSSPAISPDGRHIAWLCWDHPNMPWDGCECWLGEFDASGAIVDARLVAGGPDESIVQPQWSPGGDLFFMSDRSNWWNLYRYRDGALACVREEDAEFAGPQWVFGASTYAFLNNQEVLASYTRDGVWTLCRIHLESGERQDVDTGLCDLGYVRAARGQAVFIGASERSFAALHRYSPDSNRCEPLAHSGTLPVAEDYIAAAESIRFPLSQESGEGHAFFYPPCNRDFEGPAGSRPPLLVLCHGGPTSATRNSLNLKIQYWTSRGFAVADVNYGGSTGFGRHYRERLKGQWGVVDVQDAVDCVAFLGDRVDRDRVAIRGSSAGGYTVLAALTFHDVFKAGASLYGIGDLETLATDTHKFESRYMDNLVGPYPEQKELYRERSPIHHVDQLNCPVIFLQGLQDKIVPPNQAEAMVQALDSKGLPVAYVTFEEEAHGFRQAPNIRRALEAELYFYSRIFAFEPAEAIEPVPLRNADQLAERG
ncbi:prolyl oligopeptidase family serine peptidase [Gilvimarinus sp. F26214L]|uniref:prolyl oligopeptidase family serine peptidase n=1 Tax=Gilvimarinus sp. DZF01 TaxID=3461371 RepID=UPI0040464D65